MEILSFLDSEKDTVVELLITQSETVLPSEGFWNIAENQIILGRERYEEWKDISGNSEKQRLFICKLSKVARPGITH